MKDWVSKHFWAILIINLAFYIALLCYTQAMKIEIIAEIDAKTYSENVNLPAIYNDHCFHGVLPPKYCL